MIITNLTERAELGQPFIRFLMSDLHIGSRHSDHNLIVSQLQSAKDYGARVLVNGDVFDAIGPKDKRFDLAVLHPSLHGKKDLGKAIVDLAMELLAPFASVIDLMGIGNHEEGWINYSYGDPVATLIEKLNQEGGRIKHASVMGYVRTSFIVPGFRKRPKHKLMYLHGTGGDSPVTKGTIDFNRKGRNWTFDALTFGHKHNLVCVSDRVADVSDAGKYIEKKQLALQTGSYYKNYHQLTQDTALDYSYAQRSAHPPKPMGGIFLFLAPKLDADTGELSVKQSFSDEIVLPWGYGKVRQKPKLKTEAPHEPELDAA